VVGGVHVEHVQLPVPRRCGVEGGARHRDSDQPAVPFGDGDPVGFEAGIGQRGGPELLSAGEKVGVVEDGVGDEPAVRLLPTHHDHLRHLLYIFDPGGADSGCRVSV
jgi:hypothetical protein